MQSQQSSSLYALPPELLTKIAILTSPSFASPTHGDKRPLAVLRLTSRLLYEVASPLFWNTVRIPGNAARGQLGHNEAFARLFKMVERGGAPRPRTMVKEMLFVASGIAVVYSSLYTNPELPCRSLTEHISSRRRCWGASLRCVRYISSVLQCTTLRRTLLTLAPAGSDPSRAAQRRFRFLPRRRPPRPSPARRTPPQRLHLI